MYYLFIGERGDGKYSFVEGTLKDEYVTDLWPSAIIHRKYQLSESEASSLFEFMEIQTHLESCGWKRIYDIFWDAPLDDIVDIIENYFGYSPLFIKKEDVRIEYLEVLG